MNGRIATELHQRNMRGNWNVCMMSGVKFRGESVWILRFRQKGGRLLLWWNLELLEEMDVLQFGSVLGL